MAVERKERSMRYKFNSRNLWNYSADKSSDVDELPPWFSCGGVTPTKPPQSKQSQRSRSTFSQLKERSENSVSSCY